MLVYNSFPISVLTLTYTYYIPAFKNISAHFQLRKLSFDFYLAFFQHLLSFLNKMEPICVIHNISIAKVYDIIVLSDDLSIYSGDIFKEIVILAIISGYDYFHLLIFRFGNSSMAIECICHFC